MSTLLVAVLVAYGRHARQLRLNAERRQAITAVDQLLERWHDGSASAPRGGSGQLAGTELLWKTTRIAQQGAEALAVEVIRLSVRRSDANADQPPLVLVDFIAPKPIDSKPPISTSEVEHDPT